MALIVLLLLLIALGVALFLWISDKPSAPEHGDDMDRYQALKNKRRWGGMKITASEQDELDRHRVKNWWRP